jgi:hypothetical protein
MRKSILLIGVIIVMGFFSQHLLANSPDSNDKYYSKASRLNFALQPCLSVLSNDVTFHVINDGNDLEGAWVTIGPTTLPTDASGIAVFSLEDGDYSYTVTKDGFADGEGTFTVAGEPVQIEVEMYLCYDVTFNVIPEDSTIIIINGDTLVPGETICLPDGDYWVKVLNPGYYPFEGLITVASAPVTIEIVLDPILFGVTFFVNCCGEPLGGIMVVFNGQAIITGPDGIFILSLPEGGSYSIWIGGYIFNFSLPGTTYIDADICRDLTYHVTSEQGNPIVNTLISMGTNYLMTDINGEADTCLQVGSYSYSASKLGFVTQTGTFEMDTIAQTVEIVMPAQMWGVTIHVIGFDCDNEFEELVIIANGDTVPVGQTIYLENSSYKFEVAILGCPSLVTGNIEVENAPQTVEVNLEDFPKAYILVSSTGGSIPGVEVIVDSEDTLYTSYNNIGLYCAEFCVSGGNHWVYFPDYGSAGEFYFDFQSNIYYMLEVGLEKNESDKALLIYPNPSNGKFYLETKNTGGDQIELLVMDLTGRIVYESKQAVPETIEIDLSGQPKGMYFLRIKTEATYYTQKLIIQ